MLEPRDVPPSVGARLCNTKTQGGSIVVFDARQAARELVPERRIEARNIRCEMTADALS